MMPWPNSLIAGACMLLVRFRLGSSFPSFSVACTAYDVVTRTTTAVGVISLGFRLSLILVFK